MRRSANPTVIGSLVGLLLLGGVFVFAVLVPEATGSESSSEARPGGPEAGSSDLPPVALPDALGDDLVAVDLGTLSGELATQFGDLQALKDQEASISSSLDSVFGAPGAFRVYAAEDGSALAQVTALDRAPGLFAPEALPIDPGVIGLTRAPSELVQVDGAVCSLNWGDEVPAGQPVDPAVEPQSIRCQGGTEQRTYEVSTQGFGVEETVALIDELSGQDR